jgi:DNA-binding MarR family transcriptional regulator
MVLGMVERDRRLVYVLQRAARAALALANADAREHLGVSIEQLATLSYVVKHPGCTMTDLADVLDLNKSAMSGMIARLEQRGLLRRTPNPRDGRGTCLFVTAEGERKQRDAAPVFRRTLRTLTAGFTEAEMGVVLRFLNSVADTFSSGEGEEES